jgi:hypothetical protein
MLSLDTIRTDGGTQPRGDIDAEHVARLVESLGAAATLPPVVVFYDGADHWLADGFHRVAANRAAGALEIAADVRQGTRRDAVLYSVGANAAHGLPRSNADKRRAVETLLRDEEWSRWSDREIARHCAVDHKTVAAVRERLAASGELPQMDAPRLVERGGTVYEQRPRVRTEDPGAEIPCDFGVSSTAAQNTSPRAPETVTVRFEVEPDDDDGPLTPLEYEPEPVVRALEPDLSELAGVDVAELAAVTLFVGKAHELRDHIEAFVTEHPFESITSPRMRRAYEDAFVHLVRVIVGRMPEPLRASLFDAPAAPARPKFTVIQGGTR